MRNSDKAAKLFARFSNELITLGRESKGVFYCPICLDRFEEGDLSKGIVTLEHIIPECVGGRAETLTCKRCNNDLGSDLDSHLHRFIRSIEASEFDLPIKGTLKIDGHRTRVEVVWKPGADALTTMKIIKRGSDPAAIERSKKALMDGHDELNLNLELGFIFLRANLALLKAAYLAVFQQFGYAVALEPEFDFIRERLTSLEKPDARVVDLIITLTNLSRPVAEQISFVDLPNAPVPCFMTVLKICGNKEHLYGVQFPSNFGKFESLMTSIRTFTGGLPKKLSFETSLLVPANRAGA